MQDLQGIREEVQRLFEGAKKRNVPSYASYIVGLHNGDDGTAFIQIPWEEKLVAIDGETQLAARHEAANLEPGTKQEFVPAYICHGHDRQWARQSFHDLNTLGVKPNAALSIGMDARDPIARVCRRVEREVPFFATRVNKLRRQLRSSDADIVTITTLRGACVTLPKGINGVQFGARPVPIDEKTVPAIEVAAVDWFSAVADAIGDRAHKLASAPAVFAAIGAMGHQLIGIGDASVRKAQAKQLASELKAVNWERTANWAGIAGKISPKGFLSVGGAKENAYAVYSVLTDPAGTGYSVIRTTGVAA